MATTDDVYNELLVVRWLLAEAPKTITFTFADASTVTMYRRFNSPGAASTPAYANLANTSSVSWSGVVGSTGSWTLAHSGSTYKSTALGTYNLQDLVLFATWELTYGTGPAITSITLGTVFDLESKLPTKSYLAGTNNLDGDVELDEATGNLETGVTWQQALQRMAAILAGIAEGAGTGTEKYYGLDGVTERVRVTADTQGNRTAIEYDHA